MLFYAQTLQLSYSKVIFYRIHFSKVLWEICNVESSNGSNDKKHDEDKLETLKIGIEHDFRAWIYLSLLHNSVIILTLEI